MQANSYIVVELNDSDRSDIYRAIDTMCRIKEAIANVTTINYCEDFDNAITLFQQILDNGGMF